MGGHKRVRAAPESDKEKRHGIADVAEQRRGGRGQPPAAALPQAVKDVNVEDLPQRIGHKAGDGDARDEEIKGAQRGKALPFAHVEQRGDAVRDGQRRDHHRENDASRQRAPKIRTVRSVARKINGKLNAPRGMETKDGDRQLNQIVAGGDDQQMK